MSVVEGEYLQMRKIDTTFLKYPAPRASSFETGLVASLRLLLSVHRVFRLVLCQKSNFLKEMI